GNGRLGPTLFLLAALLASHGCAMPDPVLSPDVARELRRGEPTPLQGLVNEPPVPVKDAPKDPPAQEMKRAMKVVSPDRDTPTAYLSLPEVRLAALQNNLDIRVKEFDPAIAFEDYRAEFGKFEAIFAMSASENESYDVDKRRTTTESLQPTIKIP